MGIPTSTNPRDCADGIPDGADVRPYVRPPGIFGGITPLLPGTWIGFDGNGNPRKHRRSPAIFHNTVAADALGCAATSVQPGDETA
jgi:hypothetical protein